ncbi:MAG: dependent oxidoreductase [Frankiales bacterium]|nr:dependent oxidoreductase [Frankiales bacterium]
MTRTPPAAELASLPVAVIGAGPVGLAAAAHLADRGLRFVLLEAGATAGSAVREWGHIRTFTPWQHLPDPTAERLLQATGWTRPDTPVPPTGDELATHYLDPLAALFGDRVRVATRVDAISREGLDKSKSLGREDRPFVLRLQLADGTGGELRARAVLDASGTWHQPNPLGASGLPALGEAGASELLVGPLPDVLGRDRGRFAGRRTLVVGAGHSATNTLLNLARLAAEVPGTSVVWAIRGPGPSRSYGGGAADELAERGKLGSDLRALVSSGAVELVPAFSTTRLEVEGDEVTVVGTTPEGERRLAGLHAVAAATGFRPDLAMLAELRLDLDPGLEAPRALGPLIDPAWHSCGTVSPHGHRELAHPEPGFYVVGMKSYGRAPTFLIPTGNEQVRSVVAALAGDLEAADAVHLVLPETGVCSLDSGGVGVGGAGGCCGSDPGVAAPGAPATAHRPLPEGLPAQGFASGVRGGGELATLLLEDAPGAGGCCT